MTRTSAGASAHARYRELLAADRGERLLIALVLALLLGVPVGFIIGWQAGLATAALAASAYALARWRNHDAVRTWRRGALGERRTARRLQLLETLGYTVLHDRALPASRANLDHLVIGPTGVHLIDSKQWKRPKIFTVRGGRVRTVRGAPRALTPKDVAPALYEASKATKDLRPFLGRTVTITPVLVVHGRRFPRSTVVNGVPVLSPGRLSTWLLNQPQALTPELAARVATAARRAFPPYSS
ncbi:nuclease-related domain-containing protein [Nonomuraea typhae]|uniref:nuclease-related domain-containing protein n=1 Tax=Nonomuraea typhae TaxID=2603600 RepID=UPI0012F8A9A8|nr:nuclease-related domain-containing protein [Nonomuraea typhae]